MKTLTAVTPKKIVAIALIDDELRFAFEDGSKTSLLDEKQECCENRYMTTDDDLVAYIGSTLLSAKVEDGPSLPGDEEHDSAFLRVETSAGVFTVVTHVEHNGYYGGFNIVERSEEAQ